VDVEHLMRLHNENSVFKFLRRRVAYFTHITIASKQLNDRWRSKCDTDFTKHCVVAQWYPSTSSASSNTVDRAQVLTPSNWKFERLRNIMKCHVTNEKCARTCSSRTVLEGDYRNVSVGISAVFGTDLEGFRRWTFQLRLVCGMKQCSGSNISRKQHETKSIFKLGSLRPDELNIKLSFCWLKWLCL